MTTKRVFLAAVVLISFLLMWSSMKNVMHTHDDTTAFARRQLERRYALDYEHRIALRRLQSLQLRDSLARVLERQQQSPLPVERMLVLGHVAPATADSITNRLTAEWRALNIDSAQRPVVMAVRVDSAVYDSLGRSSSSQPGWDVLFQAPSRTPNQPCLAFVRVVEDRRTHGSNSLNDPELYQASGLCAFYAAFGDPGAGIERWLASREYDVARKASWADPLGWTMPRGSGWASVHPLQRTGFSTRQVPIATNSTFLRCSDGSRAACEALVTTPDLRLTAQPRALTSRGINAAGDSVKRAQTIAWSTVIVDQLLAAMLRSQGRERFVRFWKSEQPPATAFQQATGISLGEFVHNYVRDTLGHTARGSHLSVLAALITLIASASGLTAVTYAMHRRSAG